MKIADYMTNFPISIDAEAVLADADNLMRANGFRHLPVLRDGELIGILSDRDIKLARSLPGVSSDTTRVGQVVRGELYTVSPETPLHEASKAMAEKRIGSAVVVEDEKLVGIFTTTDALNALSVLSEKNGDTTS